MQTVKSTQSTDCAFYVKDYDEVPYLFIEFASKNGILGKLEDIRLVPVKGATYEQITKIADQLSEIFVSAEWLE